jgi:hypothetical protein
LTQWAGGEKIRAKGGEKMKKVLIPGLVAGVVMLIIGMLVSQAIHMIFPALAAEFKTALFRPWDDPIMSFYFAHPFVLGLALAFIWDKVKGIISGGPLKRATHLALGFFILSIVPGMLISYSSFPLSLLMIFSWTVSAFLQALGAGLVLAKMNG